ncbi:helix-turn-helix domain-containing protein [Streptomyces sp. NPDC001591]|uniref:helix-turn-helix domain-containing protein n=1 Tax=Streptomyces sp. NPDC001591 TaxID=3364589 RepID=UPI0036C26E32
MESIGDLIRNRRRQLGMSEEDVARALADVSGFAPTRTDVWRWESEYEGRTPDPQYLPYLAVILEVDEAALRRARAATKAARKLKITAPVSPAEVLASVLTEGTGLSPLGTTTGNTVGTVRSVVGTPKSGADYDQRASPPPPWIRTPPP